MAQQNQTQVYIEQGGATLNVGASGAVAMAGTMDITGTLKKDGVDITAANVLAYVGDVSLAEINAGKIVLPVITGRQYKIVGGYLKSTGAFAALTSIDIEDTNSSPVQIASYAQAQLTDGAEFNLQSTVSGQTKGAGWLAALTASKGVRVIKKGSNGTTATKVTVILLYVIV